MIPVQCAPLVRLPVNWLRLTALGSEFLSELIHHSACDPTDLVSLTLEVIYPPTDMWSTIVKKTPSLSLLQIYCLGSFRTAAKEILRESLVIGEHPPAYASVVT